VLIHTSGFDVGLPEGTMGNSEVGHQNIGAGRIVDQESVRITKDIREGHFFSNVEVNNAVANVLKKGENLHLFGIVSDAGVHGLLEHLYGLSGTVPAARFDARIFARIYGWPRFLSEQGNRIHSPERSEDEELGVGRVATVSGRYWSLDRDNRWQRVEKAYRAIVNADGPRFRSAVEAISYYYDQSERVEHERRRVRHTVSHL